MQRNSAYSHMHMDMRIEIYVLKKNIEIPLFAICFGVRECSMYDFAKEKT